MNSIYTDLVSYIASHAERGTFLPYRGEEELAFLTDWISAANNEKAEMPQAPSVDSLSEMLRKCVKCGKVENKKAGFGTGENSTMILLNTPAGISITERDKLKDESKELLRKMMAAIHVDIAKCYITNLIKCDSDNSFNRPGVMLKNCEPILLREIAEYKPNIIIVLGDDMPVRKMINENKSISWHKIDHPLNLIKKPELKKSAWTTLQKIETIIKSAS
ncbi:MAG: uracil-DNA glycosylase family protein [Spirochaetota bacterium]